MNLQDMIFSMLLVRGGKPARPGHCSCRGCDLTAGARRRWASMMKISCCRWRLHLTAS